MRRRVLFLTPQLPYPPHQGTALRNYGLIAGLARHGYDVSLISFVEPGQPSVEMTPLASLCQHILTVPAPAWTSLLRLRALLGGQADMARRRWSPEFASTVRELLAHETVDIVHVEGIEMAPYLTTLRAGAPGALLIYDAHNAEYALQRRIAAQDIQSPRRWHAAAYSLLQTALLRRFETGVCRAAGQIIAVSEADAAALRRLPHRTPIAAIPNAIAVSHYRPESVIEAAILRPSIVFTGKMDFRPNIDAVLWFASEVLPAIAAVVPDVHFSIVGQKPHRRLDALRSRPNITLTGYVDDIRPYLRAADVYVAPLRMGSGTRFKLLEAMAMGCAVVSTSIGAEGLEVRHGEHLLLADSADDLAGAVADLLRDPARRVALGQRASMLVRARYDWDGIVPQLQTVYAEPDAVL